MLYEGTPDTIEYPIGFETRKINKHGYVKINKTLIQVSTALRGLTVGLQAQGEREFVLWLGDYPLGIVSTETFSFFLFGNEAAKFKMTYLFLKLTLPLF